MGLRQPACMIDLEALEAQAYGDGGVDGIIGVEEAYSYFTEEAAVAGYCVAGAKA